jgi:hypothetical protein
MVTAKGADCRWPRTILSPRATLAVGFDRRHRPQKKIPILKREFADAVQSNGNSRASLLFGQTKMAHITELEQAVLDNLQEVLGSEALIERRLRRSRKTGKWSANLAEAVSNLHRKAAQVEQLLSILEQHHPAY